MYYKDQSVQHLIPLQSEHYLIKSRALRGSFVTTIVISPEVLLHFPNQELGGEYWF
ncbi:MAG: hypothetical protein ABJI33_05285 [Balneola sp.]